MTNPTYMICDGHSNALANGLGEDAAWRLAQELANDRGEAVYVSKNRPAGLDLEDYEPEEVAVEPEN